MSKFWAKVKFEQEKSAEHLIKAFFQDFNPASSIIVRGKEAKMEIVFQQPPMAIIDAINYCEIIEMNYGKNLKEYKEDEIIKDETEIDSEQEIAGEEGSEQTEQPKKKKGRPGAKRVKPDPTFTVNIPKLEEIAKKATSFEHFAKLVAEWLEMKRKEEFFTNLVIVSAEVDVITWKELENALKTKNLFYTMSDKIWASQQVSKKLEEYSLTMLPFLNVTRQYKMYSFNKVDEHPIEENSNEQATEKTMKNVEKKAGELDGNDIPRPRVKMECMPEIKDFEEKLACIDKTQPVEERVHYVLESMGLNNVSAKEQKQIVEIASTAVKKEKMDLEMIFIEANIPIEQTMEVRMTFSKFLNDFVQKYESGKRVKLLTFLSELQKIIMLESEIKNLSDCIN